MKKKPKLKKLPLSRETLKLITGGANETHEDDTSHNTTR